MEKSAPYILLIVGLILLALMAGYFIGRNSVSSPIQISRVPAISQPSGTININTATADQLQAIPEIGAALAQRIVDYRQTHGPFQKVEDLTLVEGISLERLTALRDYVTV